MAKLLVIKEVRGIDKKDDILGVFENDHVFSEAEIETFDIVDVRRSKADADAALLGLIPASFKWERMPAGSLFRIKDRSKKTIPTMCAYKKGA